MPSKRKSQQLQLVTGLFALAGDGVRTRDPEHGKLVLYQLSYTRIISFPTSPERDKQKLQAASKPRTGGWKNIDRRDACQGDRQP